MNSTVYIIGTSHPIQCGVDEREGSVSAFEDTLRQACRDHGINRIAEEMSCAGLVRYGVTECIGQKVAKLLGIPHHAVDLEPKERASLSLGESAAISIVMNLSFADGGASFRQAFSALVDEARECCWVGRVLAETAWPVLFICGANHARSVQSRFSRLGINASMLHADYEP